MPAPEDGGRATKKSAAVRVGQDNSPLSLVLFLRAEQVDYGDLRVVRLEASARDEESYAGSGCP